MNVTRPTFFQRLFTDNRPLYFVMTCGVLIMLGWAGSILIPVLTLSIWGIVKFIGLMLIAAALGFMLGVFPGGMLIGILLLWIEHRNGAPFAPGDEVIILSKRFPGRVTRIHAVWAERRQVRVELGDDERENVTDVFFYTDICRTKAEC